jgi:GDPmannose 4,6-dehydratase
LDYRDYLVTDEKLYRPSEVKILQGDASKAKSNIDWHPTISIDELVKEMVDADLQWYSVNGTG